MVIVYNVDFLETTPAPLPIGGRVHMVTSWQYCKNQGTNNDFTHTALYIQMNLLVQITIQLVNIQFITYNVSSSDFRKVP